MAKMLITGGAGFIGSHLAEHLLAAGHDVSVLDDLSTGRSDNLSSARSNPRLQLINESVESVDTVNRLVSSTDVVFHLASAVGVQLIVDEPVRTIRTTIHGTEVVLESAHRFNRPVLITSSSEVYGKGTRVPFSEDDDVVMGATRFNRWCYAYSKGIDEFLGLGYFRQYQLPVRIVRLFNTVGPRQVGMYGMVLPRFVEAAMTNQPLQVYGDGNQTRCFCHVTDVVGAVAKLMETPSTVGQVYNLGSDSEISMNELANRVIAIAGSSSTIQHVSYEKAYGMAVDDLPRRVPDIRRIRQAINFSPKRDLDQIIRELVEVARDGYATLPSPGTPGEGRGEGSRG